jgi:arsenate reductase
MTTPTLYGIPNCDTVKQARAWLAEHGVAHAFHDYKKQGVPLALLDDWIAALGWQALLNRNCASASTPPTGHACSAD